MSVFGGGLTSGQVSARLHPGYQAGLFYGAPLIHSAAALTLGLSANLVYLLPFPCRGGRFSGMALRQGTLAPGVSARLGVYANTGAFLDAKSLIAACVGEIDMNAGASGDTMELSFSGALTLPFQYVWMAALFSGTAQPYVVQQSMTNGGGLSQDLGGTGPAAFTGNTASATIRITGGAATYASGLPAQTTTLATNNANPGSPVIVMKAA